jgi:hypothetical protein
VKLPASGAAALCVLLALPATASASKPFDFELAPPSATGAKANAAGAGTVSPRLATKHRFNLLGMRWRGRAVPEIDVRVRRPGRGWSRWAELSAHDDHNPDPRRGERFARASDPLWVGSADGVQYRLSRPVKGLRLHFVNVAGAGRRARAAQDPQPDVVSRAEWGAAGCPPRESADYGTVKAVHVHHTVSLNDYAPTEAPAMVLAICRYHRNSNGWNDIGYNALVDKYGTLFEGRAGGLDQAVIGAQAQGFNSVTAGIANIGDHTSLPQTAEAIAALATYIRWKLTAHGQPLAGRVTVTSSGGSASRYGAGARVTLERVIGHRDTGRTACPGAALYAQLPELRTLVETGSVAPFQSFATRLSAGLSVDSIDFGEPAPVSGALLDPSGLPLAGERLELQVASDGSWRTARRITTGPDGAFFTELKPARRMYVRVRYPGRAPLRRATSTRLLLHLRPVILVTERPRSAVRGEPVTIAGSVGPRKPVLRLVVQQQRGTRWRKVYSRSVRARRGLFETSFTPASSGRYRYYLVAPADLDTDRGATERYPLRVTNPA